MIVISWIPDANYDPTSLEGDNILADIKARAEGFGDPFNYMLQSIPDGTQCWHNRLSQWTPNPWDNRNGTVTLGGDAAHAMTFHRGQGLNNAIHDVALLARKVKEKGFMPEAISEYENEMIARAREAVTSSQGNNLAVHDWDKLLKSPHSPLA